jgi:hypothetical protein
MPDLRSGGALPILDSARDNAQSWLLRPNQHASSLATREQITSREIVVRPATSARPILRAFAICEALCRHPRPSARRHGAGDQYRAWARHPPRHLLHRGSRTSAQSARPGLAARTVAFFLIPRASKAPPLLPAKFRRASVDRGRHLLLSTAAKITHLPTCSASVKSRHNGLLGRPPLTCLPRQSTSRLSAP